MQIYLIISFEYFVLKNKEGILRKVITAMVAIIGVYLVGIN